MKLLELCGVPIIEQLAMEEALLRLSSEDICIFNYNAPPAIVMGISGDPAELLYTDKVLQDAIPVIRRYSGGGTVIIDENTLFISFLCQNTSHPFAPFPEQIMRWSASLYQTALSLPHFAFRENDYVLGNQKVGGNAQYIQRGRWLHHTSFLYDFDPTKMAYLQLPKKRPAYREDRDHSTFLTTLSPFFGAKTTFFEHIKCHLDVTYTLQPLPLADVHHLLSQPHRKTTHLLTALHKTTPASPFTNS